MKKKYIYISTFIIALFISLGILFISYLNSIPIGKLLFSEITLMIFFTISIAVYFFNKLRCKNESSESEELKENEIKILKASEKYRKDFLGDVSHELKTPIFNIQGYVYTLLDGGLEDKNINIKYLKRTKKNINRLISIVEDLETISKLEAHELKLNLVNFDIRKLIKDTTERLDIKAKENIIDFKIKSLKSKYFVFADKEKITDVIENLIMNSLIYSKVGGSVKIIIEEKSKTIKITISDNGIGIAEKDKKRIFERFYRVDKSRSKKLGGTGLGLAIVKHILDAHKQKISLKSELGKGSSFSFSLQKAKTYE